MNGHARRPSAYTLQVLAAYILFTGIVLYPIASVNVPALGDYLNHLASAHVIEAIGRSPDLQRYYEVHWLPIPYLAMDSIVVPLARVFSIYNAGRIFVSLCVVLPVLGAATLHYAVYKRVGLFPLAGFLFSYNYQLSWGFLNYLFSVGVCFFVFAGWIATDRWPRLLRILLFSACALLLYFSHAFGFVAYCIAVGGYEIGRAWRAGFSPIKTVALDWLTAASQALPAMAVFLSIDFKDMAAGKPFTSYGDLAVKLSVLESPFIFLGGRAELAVASVAAIALAVAIFKNWVRLAPEIWPSALAVALAALFVPNWLFSVWGADFRFPLAVVLLLVAGFSFRQTPRFPIVFVLALAALVGVKAWVVATALKRGDAHIAEMRQVITHLPKGARVLPLQLDSRTGPLSPGPSQTTWHAVMTTVIDRDAFVPFLFYQLMVARPRPELANSNTPQGHPITVRDLVEGLGKHDGNVLQDDGTGARIYWMGWETKFDFVLLQHFGAKIGPLPDILTPVASSPAITLYRIDRR